ncbi:MAG: hypothetical protein JW840_07485 [Candidatus Thermoplasmatota archaeon]|nr:hypothetical protein [Candidatus Thermoplasmatota archaeon]
MRNIIIAIIGIMLVSASLCQATGLLKSDSIPVSSSQNSLLDSVTVQITQPLKGYLYLNNRQLFPLLLFTLVIGKITVEATVTGGPVEKVEFYYDSALKHTDYYEPFTWTIDDSAFLRHTISVKAYDYLGGSNEAQLPVILLKGGEPNGAPEPVVVEPVGNGLLFDPLWETMVISDNSLFLRAFDLANAEDIVSTSFEYSPDETHWTLLGIDTHGGFQGSFLPDGENQKIGDEGWGYRWDLSSLPEGFYHVRVTMTDERGQTGEATKKFYYDPVPPTPQILTPGYGEAIHTLTAFQATTAATNVHSMTLYQIDSSSPLRQGGGWHNQTGLGNTQQGGVGPNGAGGVNRFCAPTAVANALAGQNNASLYPPGKPGNNTALAQALAGNMSTTANNGTNPWKSTGGPNNESETDNVGAGIRAYLEGINMGCSNDDGYEVTVYKMKIQYNATSGGWYPVAGSNAVFWEAYNNEIRKGEAVILDVRPLNNGPDGKPGTPDDRLGGGHALTGRGSNSAANPDGTHSIGYVDPADGQNHTTTWSNSSGFSYIGYGGASWIVTGMWAISPKKPKTLHMVGIDTDPSDGLCVYWDPTGQPNGYETFVVDIEDLNGFIGRSIVVVEVDTIPPMSWIDPPAGPVYPDTPITISATDEEGSGVELIHYEIWRMGLPFLVMEHPGDVVMFHFMEFGIFDGPADVFFWAQDEAGNIEMEHMTNFIITPR